MKNSELIERLCSLLGLERDAPAEDVFEAVNSLRRDRSDANDTAGDLSSALSAIEEALGIPANSSTDPDPCLEAIEALKDERRAAQVAGEESGRKAREAAGLDPHAPEDRLLAEVAAMRDERIALRRMLELAASVQAVAVYDVVDRLKRRAADQELISRELRSTLSRVATELGLDGTGAVQELIDAIRKLKPQREAALSNGAWLAQAWDAICEHLRLPHGASLQDALAVIDESIDVRDRVVSQFDFSGVSEFEQLGQAVEHRILAARSAQVELSRRLAAAAEKADDLSGFEQAVLYSLGLSSGASLEDVGEAISALRAEAALSGDRALLVERASLVSELVNVLTSANARLAVSLEEASR